MVLDTASVWYYASQIGNSYDRDVSRLVAVQKAAYSDQSGPDLVSERTYLIFVPEHTIWNPGITALDRLFVLSNRAQLDGLQSRESLDEDIH